MSDDNETVCLTKEQMDNILDAHEREIQGKKGGCPKARKWIRGYWIKGKKKKPQTDEVETWVNRKVTNKINEWLDGFF